MSNRRLDQDWTIGERRIRIYGSFGMNGGSQIAASSVRGFGFGYAPNAAGVMVLQPRRPLDPLTNTPGIVLSGTGVYTITFEDTYIELVALIPTIQLASPGSNDVVGGPIVQGTSLLAPTAVIQVVNSTSGAAAAPNAADPNNRINFVAVFRDSSERFSKP